MEPEANAPDIKYLFQRIQDKCEILEAIMLLEFHDMNHLSGDPAKRNKIQRDLVHEIKSVTADIRTQTIGWK